MSENIGSSDILERCRQHFIKTIAGGDPIYPLYPEHVEQVEYWANKILPFYPEADKEVVIISVWLHDIGWADGDLKNDHAVKSEQEAIRFLTDIGYPKEKIDVVAHCVRAHRCKDVMPETIEAKILVAADSASHLTDAVYLIMLSQPHLKKSDIVDKLERDYSDVNAFLPEDFSLEIDSLFTAWKALLKSLPEK